MTRATQGIKAKKSLGQNFLSHKPTLVAMANSVNVQKDQVVVEVGPGKGALTKYLLEEEYKVIAIEKDDRLISYLNENFSEYVKSGQLEVVNGDVLEIDFSKLFPSREKFHIVANLPYYITGIFIRQTLESARRPESMTLLLQKEVVDRILATDGKESLLAISVKAYGEVKRICNVSKRYFTPKPKVDSAVLQMSHITDSSFTEARITEEQFFIVLKKAFAGKRKTLLNNFKGAEFYADEVKEKITPLLTSLGYNEKIRAEKIETKHWFAIAKEIFK